MYRAVALFGSRDTWSQSVQSLTFVLWENAALEDLQVVLDLVGVSTETEEEVVVSH